MLLEILNMMNKMKFLLCACAIAVLTGCSTTPSLNPEGIVNSHYKQYVKMDKAEKGDNENVAAILKVFITDIISTPAMSWSNIQVRADIYFDGLVTNTISVNYTLMATEGEIDLTESLINDSIKYYIQEDAFSLMAGSDISDTIATPFIWRINDYEYQEP